MTKVIIGIGAFLVLMAFFVFSGDDGYYSSAAKHRIITQKVEADAVKRFEIAYRSGDRMQAYTRAGICSAVFLEEKDEANYNKWLSVQRVIGKELGMPQYR